MSLALRYSISFAPRSAEKNVSVVLTQSNAEEIATAVVVTPKQTKTTINNNVKGCVLNVRIPFLKSGG